MKCFSSFYTILTNSVCLFLTTFGYYKPTSIGAALTVLIVLLPGLYVCTTYRHSIGSYLLANPRPINQLIVVVYFAFRSYRAISSIEAAWPDLPDVVTFASRVPVRSQRQKLCHLCQSVSEPRCVSVP